jgi:excisionase family DNA binding protein
MKFLYVSQAARVTGIPRSTLQTWINQKKVRSERIGGIRYINHNDIKKLVEAGYVPGKVGRHKKVGQP